MILRQFPLRIPHRNHKHELPHKRKTPNNPIKLKLSGISSDSGDFAEKVTAGVGGLLVGRAVLLQGQVDHYGTLAEDQDEEGNHAVEEHVVEQGETVAQEAKLFWVLAQTYRLLVDDVQATWAHQYAMHFVSLLRVVYSRV